ncbi:FAD/NAD(P)-binding domain-containing protein [Dendrothele bispora CBS 962.96]|uniref:FAD/NAD(P)-binding domain-containing protein n=1 Tax=Dendrothele bispora (strain CBS 962.96) TaxID=1314807 RepID=A0A4S8L2L1_DENBC|nr:FAD/NAD(P)-binding domain-containing protein [Dendrothele bispora CBS 962.96]
MKFDPRLAFFAAASFYAVNATSNGLRSENPPVCIVGAGPAGLTAAHELEAKGYPIVLFERQIEVGGKCQAYYDGPDGSFFHPLGAIVLSNATYIETVPIVEAAGVPFLPAIGVTSGWNYPPLPVPIDPETVVNVTQTPVPTEQQIELLEEELERYIGFWESEFLPFSAIRYTNGVPPDFAVPIGQWLSENGFQILPTVMMQGLSLFGYGDLNHTATIYALQYFTPDIIGYFSNVVEINIIDFHAVMVHYASSIQGPIYTSTTVTKIDRSGPASTVTYVKGGSSQTQECSKVVMAFPPLLEALTPPPYSGPPTNNSGIDISLTPSEQAVFSKVGITAYWSGAISMPQVSFNNTFSQLPTEPIVEPVLATRIFPGSDVVSTYSWGPFQPFGRSNVSLEQARELLLQTYSVVDFSPANGNGSTTSAHAPVPVTDQDVREFRVWDYFPRFQSGDLANGIYEDYNALQGQADTYWISALNGFESVEFAVRAGKEIVATFF